MLKALVKNPIIAWIILLVSLISTISAYVLTTHHLDNRDQTKFESETLQIIDSIQDRFSIYEQTLRAGVAYIYGSENVSHQEWKTYLETINTPVYWPGIQGIGWSVAKHSQQDDKFSTSVVYLEPLDWRNKRAVGYDMWSEPVRRKAMKSAMETGLATTSGIITLVQETNENIQKGFLTYLPVYKTRSTPATVKDRKEQIWGWVYAPFRIKDFIQGTFSSTNKKIEFQIYDGEQIDSNQLLYQSKDFYKDDLINAKFTQTTTIQVKGHSWTFVFYADAIQEQSPIYLLPTFIVIAGVLFHMLLFATIFVLYYSNKTTEKIVLERTEELQKAKTLLEDTVKERTKELKKAHDNLEQDVKDRTLELQNKIKELEAINQASMGREERMIELKKQINQLSIELGKPEPYDLSLLQKT